IPHGDVRNRDLVRLITPQKVIPENVHLRGLFQCGVQKSISRPISEQGRKIVTHCVVSVDPPFVEIVQIDRNRVARLSCRNSLPELEPTPFMEQGGYFAMKLQVSLFVEGSQ